MCTELHCVSRVISLTRTSGQHCGEVSKAYCRQCARLVCYKCLLGGCRVHSDDAIDVENVAHNYVEALLRECDRVQKAFHDTLQTTAEAQAAATTADIRQMAVELQQQLQRTVEAQLAAATADIHATAALLQQQGDVVIEAERQRVRGSLDRLQARVQDALPCSDDMRALVNVLCSECEPWFSVDVQEHRLKRVFESSGTNGTALVLKMLILKPYVCPLGYRSDNDQLSNMIPGGWDDDLKVHVFLDKTIHIE